MITLLKLGGSVLTDKSKPYSARPKEMKRLSGEIKKTLEDLGNLKLIIGNGGGSFPHRPAKKGRLHGGIRDAWQLEHLVEAHRAAGELNHMLVSALVKGGVPAISVKPSSAAYSDNREIVDFNVLMLEELLKLGAVPVIHGDVLVDLRQGCSIASTEDLFRYVAGVLPTKRIIIGTDVDGVLDDKGEVIPEVNDRNFQRVRTHIKEPKSSDVTGGMLHKVESMLDLASRGHEVLIINALKPGSVAGALKGSVSGTRITHG